jgi:hypothetical protein
MQLKRLYRYYQGLLYCLSMLSVLCPLVWWARLPFLPIPDLRGLVKAYDSIQNTSRLPFHSVANIRQIPLELAMAAHSSHRLPDSFGLPCPIP